MSISMQRLTIPPAILSVVILGDMDYTVLIQREMLERTI